jgi:hypothetical protein
MRISLSCMQCFREQGKPDDLLYPAELQDNGLYWLRCRAGHETVTCLQEQKFEILYDLAANAILDGYYREAVMSFTSALERFYEFYIQVMAIKRNVPEKEFEEAWKRVAAQSERQYGAYVLLYTLENGVPPPRLSDSRVRFRNDVIHKGIIPSKDKSVDYGEAVLEAIEAVLSDLKVKTSQEVNEVVKHHVMRTHEQIKGNPLVTFMTTATTISISRAVSEPRLTLKDTLLRLADRRQKGGW